MRNLGAIFSKEMRSYLVSPIGYIMAAVFLVFTSYFFYTFLIDFVNAVLAYQQQAGMYGGYMPYLNVNLRVISPLFSVLGFVSLFIIPMLTMRLYAEEKKLGTMELLLTSPLTTGQTLLGKFFACFALYAMILGLTIIYFVILEMYGEPDWGPILSSYLGVALMGAAFIAVGMLASSLTENQIIAVAIAFCALLLFWVIGWISNYAGPKLGAVLSYLWINSHTEDFLRGVIDTKDIVFYLSFIFFWLFLTYVSVESRKWRR